MKNTLHGYMTVEAALIMPIVWFAVFFLIFAGFFQYDRCVAQQDCKMMVMRASDMREEDEATVLRKIVEKGELADRKKLLFSGSVQKDFRMSKNNVRMRIEGKVNTVLNRLIKETDLKVFAYASEYETEKYDPVRFIRICRRIEKYAGS